MTLRAIIFDFDGLIIETEGPEYESWWQIYADYGVDLPRELWAKVIGSDFAEINWDPYTYLAEQSGQPIDKQVIRAKRRPLHRDLVAQQPVMPGVVRLLDEAQAAGLRVAVASSSSRQWVESHLKRVGLYDRFDAIRTRDDVAHIKPAPDLFLAAANALSVEPSEAVVLEDSSNGVRAAKTAGMMVVAVPHDLTKNADLSAADRIVNSLDDLSVDTLSKLKD